MDRRTELFNGKFSMPTIKGLKSKDARAYKELELMFNAMFKAYLAKGAKGTVNMPYWAKRVQNPRVMNIALKVLSEAGYITVSTQPHRNWSEARINEAKLLKYVTRDELTSIRKQYKWSKYLLSNTEVDLDCANVTKLNGEYVDTGLERIGFAKAGMTQFQFDTDMIHNYYDEVVKLINYGIEKTLSQYPQLREDFANYGEVGKEVVDTYLYAPATYNSGNRANDSRGRDIAGYLDKIGNPVGYKIMRSLLVIPEEYRQPATEKGLRNVYLFIAELAGYKSGTIDDKAAFGEQCYNNRFQHELDLSNEKDLKELPENIWLQRLYADVDAYKANSNHKWVVPVEIDMSASVLGYIGLLLGDRRYIQRCNMLGDSLQDAWAIEGIPNRKQAKTIMRQLYGSTMSPREMWNDMGIDYTHDEVIAFEKQLKDGELSAANAFKDFILNNVSPKAEMSIDIWGEPFTIKCNKWFNRGEVSIKYDLYDSRTGGIRRIIHTDTIKVPNLYAFRRFFVTLLIHHLDSRVADNTARVVFDTFNWVLPIHDAFILSPESADLAREVYANNLETIYRERNQILQEYFRSIGIPAKAIAEWKTIVMGKVEPLTEEFKCSKLVLK
jgi:hypothetical protein